MSARHLVAALTAIGAAAAASLTLAAPASAQCCADYVTVRGAQATFYPDGELLYLDDMESDGHHVVAYYRTSNHLGVRTLTNYKGAFTGGTGVDLSIDESGWISINVCVAEGSTLIRCSGYSPRFSASNPYNPYGG